LKTAAARLSTRAAYLNASESGDGVWTGGVGHRDGGMARRLQRRSADRGCQRTSSRCRGCVSRNEICRRSSEDRSSPSATDRVRRSRFWTSSDVQPRGREAPRLPNRWGRRSGSSEWINLLRHQSAKPQAMLSWWVTTSSIFSPSSGRGNAQAQSWYRIDLTFSTCVKNVRAIVASRARVYKGVGDKGEIES
jgi:hypothetical protein